MQGPHFLCWSSWPKGTMVEEQIRVPELWIEQMFFYFWSWFESFEKDFFLTSNGYFISQIWSVMDNQTRIEQSINLSALWKDLVILAKKIRKLHSAFEEYDQSWNLRISIVGSLSVEKFGHTSGSLIMSIQSILKFWHMTFNIYSPLPT